MSQTLTRRARSSQTTASTAKAKARKLARLLDRWLADNSGYDERTWPRLKKAIEENRLSSRKRFDD